MLVYGNVDTESKVLKEEPRIIPVSALTEIQGLKLYFNASRG